MNRMRFCHAFLFFAILVVAMASIVSVARMSPNRSAPPIAAYLAISGTLDDLCGDGSSHEEYHCPFCRLLGDLPKIDFSPHIRCATFARVWQDLAHLTAQAHAGNPNIAARAPPRQV